MSDGNSKRLFSIQSDADIVTIRDYLHLVVERPLSGSCIGMILALSFAIHYIRLGFNIYSPLIAILGVVMLIASPVYVVAYVWSLFPMREIALMYILFVAPMIVLFVTGYVSERLNWTDPWADNE